MGPPDQAGRGSGRLRRMLAILAIAGFLVAPADGTRVAARQEQPTATAGSLPPSEIDLGAPHLQAIAQGVVSLNGMVVWRVREVSLIGTAAPETGGFSFLLQRTGAGVVRNELTGRRARLEPGEAYFMATGDPYVRSAVGPDPTVSWIIELVAPDTPLAEGLDAGTVLFTSDPIPDYPTGTHDAELLRGVLMPGEEAELPDHTGPALVMVTSGRLQAATDAAAPTAISAGGGLLSTGALTIRNDEAQPTAFVVAVIGDPVEGAEVAPVETVAPVVEPPPAPAPAPVEVAPTPVPPPPEPTAAPVVAPSGADTDGDGLSDEEEIAYGSDPLNRDYDADGLLDGEEVFVYGTDPLNNDTDGDGLLDGDEVHQFGTNPLSSDGDGDGLLDGDEIFVYGTDPNLFDTDGDGVPDGEEVLIYGTDPLDPASGP